MTSRFLPSLLAILSLAALAGCNDDTGGPGPAGNCPDQSVVAEPSGAPTTHAPKRVAGRQVDSLEGIRFAPTDSVDAFFGGKAVKLAFVLDRKLYLVEWEASGARVTDLTEGDEGHGGGPGNINSPLFSPDGTRLAYGGTLSHPGVAFVRGAVSGSGEAWRVPVETDGHSAFDPHWVRKDGEDWIYFATDPGPVSWSDRCAQMGGSTYRARAIGDSAMGPVEATGLPGSFKGGLSKDLRWAGTSYGPSALHDTESGNTVLLAGLAQQCNPSMNPYPPGSLHMDFMMILGFGGTVETLDGEVTESIHENLWIYDASDRAVWRGRLPGDPKYRQWQKPEWSTHPEYATAVALHGFQGDRAGAGDLFAVRIGDLAAQEAETTQEPRGYLNLAAGRFTESSFSHLWVEP
jgi:hypothetical protein